jgi:putative MATE family efflux protein
MTRVPSVSQRSLFSLSWPILFELLMLYMIPIVDAYYMSRISSEAVAAVSAVLPLTGVAFVLFLPLTQAASSVAAQHLGARNTRMAGVTFSLMLLMNLALGVCVTILFSLLAPALPQTVGLDASLAAIASQYLAIIGLGFLPLALRIATSGVLNALGQTKVNMFSAVFMNVLNLIGNHAFVSGFAGLPAMGVKGIALASLLSWVSALLLGLWYCRSHFVSPWSPDIDRHEVKGTIRYIFRNGLPSTLEPLSYQLSQVAITKMLVQLGLISLNTKAFVGNITLFALLWSSALAGGTQIKIAHLLGAGAYEAATKQMLDGLRIALVGCTLLSLVLAVGASFFLGIFSDDPDIIRLGSQILWVAIVLESGRCLNVVVGAALRASGDARFVAAFGLFSMWAVAVAGSYLFGLVLGWGLLGIWIVMSLDEHIRGWVSLYRWKRAYWQSKILYRRDV